MMNDAVEWEHIAAASPPCDSTLEFANTFLTVATRPHMALHRNILQQIIYCHVLFHGKILQKVQRIAIWSTAPIPLTPLQVSFLAVVTIDTYVHGIVLQFNAKYYT